HPAHRRRQGPGERGAGGAAAAGRGTTVFDLAGEARGRDLSPRRGGAAAVKPARRGAAVAPVCPRRGAPLRAALPPHPASEKARRIRASRKGAKAQRKTRGKEESS